MLVKYQQDEKCTWS